MTFETFDVSGYGLTAVQKESVETAHRQALDFAANPERWILFYGEEHGCGKTHLAAAIGNYRRGMGDIPCFVRVADLLRYLRSTFDAESSESYYRAFERVRTAPLLILDDLDVRPRTTWARQTLWEIIDHRYTNVLPTVITTTMSQASLTMRDKNATDDIAQRLATRLWDPSLCTDVEIRAPSFRASLPKREAASGEDSPGRRPRGRKL
jgi:DNA replication protein DnaC